MTSYETILITGGAGFVGSNLALNWKRDNPRSRVIALDNLKRRGSELNVNRLKTAGVEFLHGDIRNKEDLAAAGEFDLMIECSAEPSVLSGYNESPEYLLNTNLMGTVNCLEMVRTYKADMVFLSTSRVYPIRTINELKFKETETRFELEPDQIIRGVSTEGISEGFPLEGTRSLYGATKLASELILQEYIEMYGIRGIVNRCGVITGPWQMGKIDQGVVVLWIAKHIFNSKLLYIGYGGTGKQVRDILHIDDLYRLIRLQVNAINNHSGQIYNVGGGREVSLSLCELTKLCAEITGEAVQIGVDLEKREADIPYYVSDFSKVRKASGWKPEKSVRDIVYDVTNWIMDNKQHLEPILS